MSYYDHFFYHMISHWQCGPVVWEPPIPLASVLSCPVVCAKSGKERVRLSRWRHSSCTVESRIDRAENAMGLGWSHPRSPRGRSVWSRKFSRTGRSGASPLWCYSYLTSSTTYSNACLWLGAKNIFVPNQRPARIYRAAFVILHKGVDPQTRLLPLRPC